MKTREMTTTKVLTRMAAILMLAVGLMTSAAMAQSNERGEFRPIGYYVGVETAAGTLEPTSGTTYGNTLVMNGFGEWDTHCLTVSLDYSITQFVPDSFIVTGGSWSLVVFRDKVYVGTIYGKVLSGNVLLSANNNGDPIQLTQINLQTTGGLGEFEGKEIKDHSGVFDGTTDLRSNSAEGRLEISN